MADFCSQAPDRWAGFAQVFLDDIDAAVAEVHWAKEAGLRGILLPADHVLKLANLYYPHLDPLWAACAEVGLPIHRHASFPTESVQEGGDASALVGMVETQFFSIRSLGHLILSGAFERHPDLVFVLTEITAAAELPAYLARLDGLAGLGLGAGTPLYAHIKDALAALTPQAQRVLRHATASSPARPTTCGRPMTSGPRTSCGVRTCPTPRARARTRSRCCARR